METKEMTKKEIFAYLNNAKVICTNEEETRKVQEKLFELDIEWGAMGKRINVCAFLIYIVNQELTYTNNMEWWVENDKKRIDPKEILEIQLKEEKPKFDPKTLQPFDKVLVRDKEGDRWRCNLFCHINEELMRKYFCVFDNWIYCIPYNEETKHLHDTNNEAPEFYRM